MDKAKSTQSQTITDQVSLLFCEVRELWDGLELLDWDTAMGMSNAVEIVRWWDENWMDLDMDPRDVDWYGSYLYRARKALEKLEELTDLEEINELLEVV